jgi:hypothetical protein
MTSRPLRKRKPILGVELRVEVRGLKDKQEELIASYPGARKVRGGWRVKIRGGDPAEVAEKARELLQIVRKEGERV